MLDRIYRSFIGVLWRSLFTLLLSLAIAVSATTVLLSLLPSASNRLSQIIEAQTGLVVDVGTLVGEMSGFRPQLKISDISIYADVADLTPIFEANELQITLNPWRSLLQRQLILSDVKARDVALPARLENAAGSIVIPIDPGVFASEIERLTLRNTNVTLLRGQGEDEAQLALNVDLDLRRDGSQRDLRVSARGDGDLKIDTAGSGIGDPFDLRGFVGQITGRITAADISPISTFFNTPVLGRGEIYFWTDAANGVFASTFQADGEIALDNSDARSNEISLSVLGLAEFEGTGAWLHLDSINVGMAETQMQLDQVHLGLLAEGWKFIINDVEVNALAAGVLQTGLVPLEVATQLASMQPSGKIEALSLAGGYSDLIIERASLDIRNLGLVENTPLPEITNLSATLAYDRGSGSIQVQSEDFSFSVPTQFTEPLALGSVSALADFEIIEDRLLIKNGRVFSDAGDFMAKGLISASLPLSTTSDIVPELSFILGAESAPTSRVLAFTPYRIDPEAYEWMQTSIGDGQANKVGFVMRGGLRSVDIPSRSIQLSALADLDAVKLMPGLPDARNLRGHVAVDNALVTFEVDSADVGTLQVPTALVQVGRVEKIRLLQTTAQVSGAVPDAISEIASIPYVPANVATALRQLETEGDMTAEFELAIPIKGAPRIPEITTRGVVSDADFSYRGLALRTEKLNGDIVYQYPMGITGGSLSGTLFDKEIMLDLRPAATDLGVENIGFSLSTDATLSISDIASVVGITTPNAIFDGESEFAIAMQAGEGLRIQVTSDLEGVRSNLPDPLYKPQSALMPLTFDLDLSSLPKVEFELGDVLRGVGLGRREGWSALTHVGKAQVDDASFSAAQIPTNTLEVTGQLDQLDLMAWTEVGAQFDNQPSSDLAIQWRDFALNRLSYGAAELFNIRASGEFTAGLLEIDLASDLVDGSVTFDQIENSIMVAIDRVNLDQTPGLIDGMPSSTSSPLTFSNESTKIIAAVDGISYGEVDLGSVGFSLEAAADQITLGDLAGEIDGVRFSGQNEIKWIRGEAPSTSALIDLQLGASESTLTTFDTSSVVGFTSGEVQGELAWQGSPLDISLANSEGQVKIALNDGSFLPVSAQATGPLRFISLFNLAGLVQQANVNQLFDPGLTFDKASGDLSFDSERVVVNEFAIRNGGGSLDLGGNFFVASETIDAELTVTLPLVDNIPWVAALAGGLPIAAGAYLASRVFEDQVNRLSSGVYSVSGPLDSPEVTFMRVFDARRSAEMMTGPEEDQASDSASESERR